MKKFNLKYKLIISLVFLIFLCIYIKNNDRISVVLTETNQKDILNNKIAIIDNIDFKVLKEIKVLVGAKNAYDFEYIVKGKEITKQNEHTISIPIYYLVADKTSKINIKFILKNGRIITKKLKTIITIKNNKNIEYNDSIPDIIVNKTTKRKNNNILYKITYLIWDKKRCINIFFIDFDVYGNIRKISNLSKEDINIDNYIYEQLDRMKIETEKSVFRFPNEEICEILMEIDKNSSKRIKTFDLKKILGINYSKDWLHSNSLAYSKWDNSILISSRHLGGGSIIKIDMTGKLIYILADPKFFIKEETKHLKKYLLNSLDENNFEWAYRQHNILCLDETHIMMFDNGGDQNGALRKPYSRAVIYEVNEKNMTVKQIWQYGKELGDKFYSLAHGNVLFDSTDNENKTILINSPLIIYKKGTKSIGNIREIDMKNNNLIFNAYIKPKNKYFSGKDSYFDYVLYLDKNYI